MDVTLHTNRLMLRPLVQTDIPAIVAGLNDFEVTRFLTRVPHPYTEEDARTWFATLHPPVPGAAHFAIERSGFGTIGAVGIESELGYWLDRRHHGLGLMTEAAVALLNWHFDALPNSVVASGAHLGNTASLRVQEKLGFIDTGRRDMRYVRSQGREVEHLNTSLVRTAYEAARQKLRVN